MGGFSGTNGLGSKRAPLLDRQVNLCSYFLSDPIMAFSGKKILELFCFLVDYTLFVERISNDSHMEKPLKIFFMPTNCLSLCFRTYIYLRTYVWMVFLTRSLIIWASRESFLEHYDLYGSPKQSWFAPLTSLRCSFFEFLPFHVGAKEQSCLRSNNNFFKKIIFIKKILYF